jgi:hypothetical protein
MKHLFWFPQRKKAAVVGGRSGSEFVSRLKKGIKMKKILAAILAGAFGLTAVAQTVVYDYKASFKRVNPVYKVRKVDGAKMVTESYGVSSDSLRGYVILPLCTDCNGPATTSFGNAGTAYLTRKGDKYSKAANLPFVLKTAVLADSAIFGKSAYVLGDNSIATAGNPHALKDLKSAWMRLSFVTPDAAATDVIDSGLLIKEASGTPVWYGFLGLDNYLGGIVNNAGFGSAKVLTTTQAATLGWCGGLPGSTTSCQMVRSISGSTLASFGYDGLCGAVPMWDVCVPDTTGMVAVAPIAGTWSLKFNNKMSNAANQEAEILKKLKAAAADVVDTTVVPGAP